MDSMHFEIMSDAIYSVLRTRVKVKLNPLKFLWRPEKSGAQKGLELVGPMVIR